jgi:uncharacterized protein (TIGR03067 family)
MTPLLLAATLITMPHDASPVDLGMHENCRLAGEWFLLQTRDEKRSEAGSEAIRMSVARDGGVIFTFENVETNRGTFRLCSRGKSSRIDLRLPDGRTFEGVFKFRDDTAILCFSEVGKPRPPSIDPRRGQWAEHWKRVAR